MDGNVGRGGQSRAIGMGKRLGLGSRKENLRKSSGTGTGSQKVSKTGPECVRSRPVESFRQVPQWHSARTGWQCRGPLPHGCPRVGWPASALEDSALVTYGWRRPDVLLLPVKRIVSFSERCSFTWRELPSPTLPPPTHTQRRGKLFWNLFLVGSLKRSFMFIF